MNMLTRYRSGSETAAMHIIAAERQASIQFTVDADSNPELD